jgi:bidirectional [NiFe] hydrogenase diaphorase subunit
MTPFNVTIDERPVQAEPGQMILSVCKQAGIDIPVLCAFEGLSTVGACRLCLVEIQGSNKLLPACITAVAPGQVIQTQTERLKKYRRMTLELLFAERNHICSVCVANNNCDLQDLAHSLGMDHVRFPYLFPSLGLDASHEKFVMDQNRCILCTRCVRVCDEVEGAHTWDVMGRGTTSRIISDFNQPWGDSDTCTSCGKCVEVCPTGALWPKEATSGRLEKSPETITELIKAREAKKQ